MSAPAKPEAAKSPLASVGAFLRGQSKRNLLLLALVPVLVGAWLPILTGGGDAAPPPAVTPEAAPTTSSSPSAPGATPPTEAAAPLAELGLQPFEQRLQVLARPYVGRWSADRDPAPFRMAGDAAAADVAVPIVGSSWAPTAIVMSPTAPAVAIVQGAPRQVGDRIGERTLIAIEEHSVVYRQGDQTIPIPMPERQLGGRP